MHVRLVLAPPQHDAAYVPAAIALRDARNALVVRPTVESFDLPDIRLDARLLELTDGALHETRPKLLIIRAGVRLYVLELPRRGGYEKLEHVFRPCALEVVREAHQTRGLALVHGRVTFRIVAYEHLAEGGRERGDMLGEVLAELEVELVLPALLHRYARDASARARVAQYGGAELLVNEDPRLFARHAAGYGRREAVVDDALGRRDPLGLLRVERSLPAEHPGLE